MGLFRRGAQSVLGRVVAVAAVAGLSAGVAQAADLDKAPPPFGFRTGTAVPVDMDTVDIQMTFDATTRKAVGRAYVSFRTGRAGMPFLDLVPDPTAVRLDGVDLSPADFVVTNTPGAETKVRVLAKTLAANTRHELYLEYPVPEVKFVDGKVQAGFFMSDLSSSGREFFEQYGPANLEFDQVAYKFDVRLQGTSVEHEIFTNGAMTEEGAGEWQIVFPPYFTTSSLYFHISEKGRFNVQRYVYDGIDARIPVTVYSATAALTEAGAVGTRRVLTELEGTYGAFAHPRVIVYMTADGGGMEHCGATMTSERALGHELTHSYFARGVMPANGNAGWIDESIASWRDNSYPRATAEPNRAPVRMSGFTAYRRHTSGLAYSSGAKLISEFDYMFRADGGMRAVLRQLFSESKLTTINVGDFQSFLERVTGANLTAIFQRYVFGQSTSDGGFRIVAPETFEPLPASTHPRPYTQAELARYR